MEEPVRAKDLFRDMGPERFLSTIWRHSRRWAIPIPKGKRELLDPDKLYKIEIAFTKPDDKFLMERIGHLIDRYDTEVYKEVTKVWKSGKRRLFPITNNTARRIVPKLQELREATELIIEEATIEEAIEYLLRTNPRYRKLKRELYRELNTEFYLIEDIKKRDKRIAEIEKEIKELMEEYRPKAEELVAKGEFKPGTKVEFAKEWIKAPLLITVWPYEVEDDRKAIALYKRAPMPLDEEDL